MSKVLGLDAKTSTLAAWFGFTSGSTLLLVGLMAFASVVAWVHTAHGRLAASAPEEIDVMKEDAPPPPRAEPEAKPEPVAMQRPQPREAPPPPAPAQAAKVLAQEPDPNEPVDLTGNTIVQGNGDTYAGGFTTANGTSGNAVRGAAVAGGVPGGTGPVRPAPQVGTDRSRAASVGATEWNAPFPPEADAAQIDDAYVMLQVDVRPDGTPAAVRVLSDPGNGFGREARQYALRQHYSPALDHDGNAIAATTRVRVHFSR
ncbi:MAG: energy transducer TonB [Myxococcota bacterium]|nr:energy transducer TonB [Myxococcota bacterium]